MNFNFAAVGKPTRSLPGQSGNAAGNHWASGNKQEEAAGKKFNGRFPLKTMVPKLAGTV